MKSLPILFSNQLDLSLKINLFSIYPPMKGTEKTPGGYVLCSLLVLQKRLVFFVITTKNMFHVDTQIVVIYNILVDLLTEEEFVLKA